MTFSEKIDIAVDIKDSGDYNCSQFVAAVLADETDYSEEELANVAAGFGGGMGNLEATCGALIGVVLVAGFKTKGNGTVEVARRIQEEFAKRCGAIRCRDLQKITDGKPLCSCKECARNALKIYGEVMGLS